MLKSTVTKIIILLAALLLQFSLVQRLDVFSFTADLCVLALAGVCFFSTPPQAAVFGAGLGLLCDGAAGRGFGVNLLLYMFLAVGIKALAGEKINNSPAIMAAYVWLFTLLYYIAYGLLSFSVPRGDIGVGRWLLTAAVTAVINAVLAVPAFWLTDKLRRGGADS